MIAFIREPSPERREGSGRAFGADFSTSAPYHRPGPSLRSGSGMITGGFVVSGLQSRFPKMKKFFPLALCALLSATAYGEIAIFTGGRTMKIESYTAGEESMDLVLESG